MAEAGQSDTGTGRTERLSVSGGGGGRGGGGIGGGGGRGGGGGGGGTRGRRKRSRRGKRRGGAVALKQLELVRNHHSRSEQSRDTGRPELPLKQHKTPLFICLFDLSA
ncbi:unnamed protein product [Pleuronectes platessa]|uniref:Uncharacterized protein n=1 Tax=Pleuronectes platessa TaxID=8262 RepID=A0A9N7VD25_PLEPL|nr:unnamed protein product [Pleuronectes platessa]